jgi:DNA (cytosine-5)-methyltransferase 1
MKFGSVCSGIEAASVAWEPLGWKAAWFSEIEPFPCAVLKHHYPDVPNFGDMTTLPKSIISGEIEAPDLFCGGTPCQAFSVAGMRKSLDDARGNLSLTFCEIANAIDNVRLAGGEHPAIIFWENVPGVLSTKDNAFGCFLAGLAGEDGAVEPPGGKWANAGCVYGLQRAVAWRILDAQYFGVAQRRRRVFVVASARADFDPAAVLFEFDGVRRDIAPSRETRQAVAGTIEASLGRSRGAGTPTAAICPTLRAGGNRTGGDRPPGTDVDTADSLIVQQPYAVGNTLTARMHKGINSTLDEGQTPVVVHGTQDPCVSDIAFAQGRNNGGENVLLQAMAFQQTADCLTSAYGTKWNGNASAINGSLFAAQAMAVRRLTPVECERLQGFPDGYTQIPWRKKPASECPDGPRYKALGNSWAVPVVRWIGKRIEMEIKCKPKK